ncbi:MAG: EF-hand domain-containing protein [Gemmataceae bacterium]
MRRTLLLLLTITPLVAADPGKLERGVRQYTPKGDAFAPGTLPFFRSELQRQAGPFKRDPSATVQDTYEVLFLARTRPVRIRVVTKVAGGSLNERFEKHLKELFAAFDRDGDGALNRYEAELVYARSELAQMLLGGFGFRGQSGKAPSLEVLDIDGDGKVSFEEFAAYYSPELPLMTQVRGSVADARNTTEITAELFARLDTNNDGKLSEVELKAAEKLLAVLDEDEDETVSATELLKNSARGNLLAGRLGDADGGAMMMANSPTRGLATPLSLQAHLGSLPPEVIEQVIRWYDANQDGKLNRLESGLAAADFARLDADKDGNLTAAELEAWRTGEPDVVVTLTFAEKLAGCKAETTAGKGYPTGIDIPKPTTPDRVVLRVGAQTVDLAASPLPASATVADHPYAALFPASKQFLEEKDLVGPQYQFLRVAFDPADFDGDGKLTRAEFDRYFTLQTKTARLSMTLTHVTRVPNLFQLLDANGDGKLGVKELRTAYERLIPLEPSGGNEVTRAVLQPSAVIRFGSTVGGNAEVALGTPRQPVPNQGPAWFYKMDRNGDGDVSRLEFLGPKEDFDKLDTNRDGLISLDEAIEYEKTARPKK